MKRSSMEEIDIGKLTKVTNANLQDFVLMFTQSGALVIIPVQNLRQKTDSKIAPTADILTAGGVQSLANNPVVLQNAVGDGVTVGIDGSISLIPGANNKITLGNGNTVIEPALLTKTAADLSYMPGGNLSYRVSQTPHPFADGNPARWNGTTWVKPGAPGVIPAGATSPTDDWSGIVRYVDPNTFDLFVAGYVSLTPGAAGSPAPTQFGVGTNYWNGTAWVTAKPTVFGAFEGKVVAKTATLGIILPFKRRSTGFRPLSSLPTGAGQIETIAAAGLSTARSVLCGTSKTSTLAAAIYKSTDDGATWAKVIDAPSPFTAVNDLKVGAVRAGTVSVTVNLQATPASPNLIVAAFGFIADTAGSGWISTAPLTGIETVGYTFTRISSGFGTAGKNLRTVSIANGIIWAILSFSGFNVFRGTTTDFNAFQSFSAILDSATVNAADVYMVNGTASLYKMPTVTAGTAPAPANYAYTFDPAVTPAPVFTRIAVNGTTMLLAGGGKIFRTADFTSAPKFGQAFIEGPTSINRMVYSNASWFAATNDGIYMSATDGAIWNKIYDSAGVAVTALATNGSGKVYAGTADGKILVYG
jgi:hypothetical protein